MTRPATCTLKARSVRRARIYAGRPADQQPDPGFISKL